VNHPGVTAPVKIGLVGAGNVTPMYLPNLLPAPGIEVAAISDLSPQVATARASEYGITTVLTPDQVIDHPEIELILNFTPIPAHAETTRSALAAGKHVYSEKPLATSTADAVALVEEAERRHLRLGCAPDTLLGSGLQAARTALEGGAVGRPLGAGAFMFRRTAPSAPYATNAFALLDMAPYYVTMLVTLFGPARRVVGLSETLSSAQAEHRFEEDPISFGGVIEFDGRLLATLLLSWGTGHRHEVPSIHVYGTLGDLSVPNPNVFGEAASIRLYDEAAARVVEGSVQPPDWPRQQRGLGVAEMAEAIREDRPPRAAGDLAAHVVDVIEGIITASTEGHPVDLSTSFVLPPPLPATQRARLLGR
jgi:predicted dehydrogenase